MGLIATYDPAISRVRLEATALGATATYAYAWRSDTSNFIRYDTLRGGDHATVAGGTLLIDDYEFPVGQTVHYQVQSYNAANVQQAIFFTSILVELDQAWIKVVARPFLNRPVTVTDWSDVERPARGGVFDIVGRSFPVGVTDVRGSRRYTLPVITQTPAERDEFDLLLASGEPIFVHTPADCPFPGGHFTVGDVTMTRPSRRSLRRIFHMPLTEVAAPGPHVVGASVTWQSIINAYPTWADVIAANATWADVLELVGDPTEVIVP